MTAIEVSYHTLRRSAGMNWLEGGADIYTASRLLGHSSVEVTQRWYVEAPIGNKLAAVRGADLVTGAGRDPMMRYELVKKSVHGGHSSVDEMQPDDEGEWMRYEAHVRAVAKAVAQERDQIRSMACELRRQSEESADMKYFRGKVDALDALVKAIDARAWIAAQAFGIPSR